MKRVFPERIIHVTDKIVDYGDSDAGRFVGSFGCFCSVCCAGCLGMPNRISEKSGER